MIELQLPSPIQQPKSDTDTVQLQLKREDLIHPAFGGNKWRKLKYNLQKFNIGSYSHLVTFGGAFSNHIAATAAVGAYFSIPTIGIIRGSYVDENNVTLGKAKAQGMRLFPISREAYKMKEQSPEFQRIIKGYSRPLVVPEGGSNQHGFKGCQEIMQEVQQQQEQPYDYVVVPAGTGMTASGVISTSLKENILVVNVLKNAGLEATIRAELGKEQNNWSVLSDYHFGGYAKVKPELIDFINAYYKEHRIALDPIYNGKALYAVYDLIEKNHFPVGSRILYLLTGGQQGIAAYNSRCKNEVLQVICGI